MHKLAIAAALFVSLPCLAQNNGPCNSGYDYSASGNLRPANWGNLREDWKLCRTGAAQSPIIINTVTARREDALPSVNLNPNVQSRFRVQKTGHNLKVKELQPAWTLNWYGREATLEEFHFHRLAEHVLMVNGQPRRAEGEIHFVFNDNRNNKIVVAVWVMEGTTANPAIAKILQIARETAACDTSELSPDSTKIKMGDLLNSSWNNYATYEGSLTTPPCSEDVSFIITLRSITASRTQLNALTITSLTPPPHLGNARPLQTQGVKWRP